MTDYLKYTALACAALVAACNSAPTGPQTADLGQVLDRTEFALTTFDGYKQENADTEASEEDVKKFENFYARVLNSDPRFYDQMLGIAFEGDGSFLGYKDLNINGVKDSGEAKVFTVEIDTENQRLIATGLSGESTGLRFSGSGFLTGYIVGRMLTRQGGAGIRAGSFNNRNVTARSSYKAPKSAATRSAAKSSTAKTRTSSARSGARSGGARSGK